MKSTVVMLQSAALLLAAALIPLGGCDKASEAPKPAPANTKPSDHDHKPGDGHDHGSHPAKPADGHAVGDGHDHGDDHDHGPTIQLGEQSVGAFAVKASRDGGITPGSDAPIDAWVTGTQTKVAAVRFWIGTQDAKGSVKAKAELEKDNWHTHVEVPKPLPDGSKLWVEVEDDKGEKTVAGFELKH